jgi:3-oxoadipate enol-lactonase
VVLLHAGIADRTMWSEHVAALAAGGYRVVAPDLPGFGKAPPSPHDGAWLDVLETLDALAIDSATLVGNSFGGAVALRVAAVAPSRVSALVLVSAPPPVLDPSPELRAAWDAEEEALERGDIDAAVAAVLDTWTRPDAPASLRARVEAMQRRAFEVQLAAPDPEELPDPFGDDPAAVLAAIAVPTLVAVGAHDLPDFRAAAGYLAATLPAAQLTTIESAGHLAPLEAPAEFQGLLAAFLARG